MPEPSRTAEMSAQLGWLAPMTEKEAERAGPQPEQMRAGRSTYTSFLNFTDTFHLNACLKLRSPGVTAVSGFLVTSLGGFPQIFLIWEGFCCSPGFSIELSLPPLQIIIWLNLRQIDGFGQIRRHSSSHVASLGCVSRCDFFKWLSSSLNLASCCDLIAWALPRPAHSMRLSSGKTSFGNKARLSPKEVQFGQISSVRTISFFWTFKIN
jgi:hypothetical protein